MKKWNWKKIFDRVWSIVMIILNTAYGISMTACAFSCIADSWFGKENWQSMLLSVAIMATVNALNILTRKMFKDW